MSEVETDFGSLQDFRSLAAVAVGADHRPKFTVARYLLVPLDRRALPLISDTLPVAEAARAALMSVFRRHCEKRGLQQYLVRRAGRADSYASPIFAGKDAGGQPLQAHGHAHYLPSAEDEHGNGRIDHLTVYAAEGFGPDELAALDRFRRLRFDNPRPSPLTPHPSDDWQVVLAGLGNAADFTCPLLGRSAVWMSATPFVATRYPKLRGRKRDDRRDYATPLEFARHVLRQELERLRQRRPELPEVVGVEPLPEQLFGRQRLRSIQFKKQRRKAGDDGERRPSGAFRITFARSVKGPLCLGHSCHFGMGCFVPG